MRFARLVCIPLIGLMLGVGLGCSPSGPVSVRTLHRNDIQSLDGVISRSGVSFDAQESADGNGSLRIHADGPTTLRLFETGDLDVEDALVFYAAQLRTEAVRGKVYLEMWAAFPGRGEYFSRALDQPLSGTVGWTRQQTPFRLKAGENPENLRLNLVIEGPGTVWIDALQVTAAG